MDTQTTIAIVSTVAAVIVALITYWPKQQNTSHILEEELKDTINADGTTHRKVKNVISNHLTKSLIP